MQQHLEQKHQRQQQEPERRRQRHQQRKQYGYSIGSFDESAQHRKVKRNALFCPNTLSSETVRPCLVPSGPMMMARMNPPPRQLDLPEPFVFHSSIPATPPPSFSFLSRDVSSAGTDRRLEEDGLTLPPNPLRMATTKSDNILPKPMPAWYGTRNPAFPGICFERVGSAHLKVFRVKLPSHHIEGRLSTIIDQAERHAKTLAGGWKTDLYSLTKCDMACRDIPRMYELVQPIFDYICLSIQILYGCHKVVVDKNQPHILKYSAQTGHTGVELHHDRCDVTANLALSKSTDYVGGGTFIVEVGRVIRLNQGEFLLHPGSLVHGGMDITDGTRYLLVTFAHLQH